MNRKVLLWCCRWASIKIVIEWFGCVIVVRLMRRGLHLRIGRWSTIDGPWVGTFKWSHV